MTAEEAVAYGDRLKAPKLPLGDHLRATVPHDVLACAARIWNTREAQWPRHVRFSFRRALDDPFGIGPVSLIIRQAQEELAMLPDNLPPLARTLLAEIDMAEAMSSPRQPRGVMQWKQGTFTLWVAAYRDLGGFWQVTDIKKGKRYQGSVSDALVKHDIAEIVERDGKKLLQRKKPNAIPA